MTIRPTTIRPELTAQRRSHPPNPALHRAIDFLRSSRQEQAGGLGRVADLGCGRLRHYAILAPLSTELYLVDTNTQLQARHHDAAINYSVTEIAQSAREAGKAVCALSDVDFAGARLGLDAVFCVAVLDVVPPETRESILSAAAANISKKGAVVVIIPRNDTTILRRCSAQNVYSDGHVFAHHGTHTFFRNFRDHEPVVSCCRSQGLSLVKDLSTYRQVCLVFAMAAQSRYDREASQTEDPNPPGTLASL